MTQLPKQDLGSESVIRCFDCNRILLHVLQHKTIFKKCDEILTFSATCPCGGESLEYDYEASLQAPANGLKIQDQQFNDGHLTLILWDEE